MALQRKTAKRTGRPGGKAVRRRVESADFCAAARDALKRGEPDAISDKTLQQVLTAAVKVYAAKVERRGHDVAPFAHGTVTATETVVAACGLIRAADLNMFDVAIWFHRPPGIE
ncbi:MAG TPA: hypothetical protein VMJ52_14985 [Xanthobacteraceae bacterium]|nr:hypothetical protein [Xanthobacteraceae bacterium]